ncbi:DUF932 domain-containing protein [Streptomyces fructofermentans]|uniref:DUF932 domain-containing protein n=1 Tax=Streptomyces fructofermentans TaxID=152141 RepID=A0A918U4Q2_9ACTN|nr:DUF932 domain-containing protein [Streptomyces fructofermentans]GGX93782.1 hypothetical protein GCM10010515_70750 [Streptomyces fructofermentans]
MAHETNQSTARAAVTDTRNASFDDLLQTLERDQDAKIDMVAPAAAITSVAGNLTVAGVEPVLTPSGVARADGAYRPTAVADEGIAEKLRIPAAYLRRMRAEAVDLYDLNVNGWLQREPTRRFLLRAFKGEPGVLRAWLSDGYKIIDHLDMLTAVLAGIRESGHPVKITGGDLTERRMIVRVESEHVAALAPELLRGYRSPFTGQTGDQLPLVSAGFVLTNSEVGGGKYAITPRIVAQVCGNGMTITKDAFGKVHLGARMTEGIVEFSQDTQERNLSLISAQTRDAVATFMNRDYVERKLADIQREAGHEITSPAEAVELVAKQLRFPDSVRDSVFSHFIRGGQTTAGGIMQAITATAQTLDDGDAAYELETQALSAMGIAAAA